MFGLGEAGDTTTLAAKRVFGIGDPMNLRRRAADLAAAGEVPVAALDLALVNWGLPAGERVTAGSTVAADPAVVGRLRAVLGVRAPDEAAAGAAGDAAGDDGHGAPDPAA